MKNLDKLAGQLADFMSDCYGTIERKGTKWICSDGGATWSVTKLNEEEAAELDKKAKSILDKGAKASAKKAKAKAAQKKPLAKALVKGKSDVKGGMRKVKANYSWVPEIHKGKVYEIDTDDGSFVIPFDVVGPVDLNAPDTWKKAFELFLPDPFHGHSDSFEIEDITLRDGYYGRYHAPGYTDSSDWEFDTDEKKLKESLDKMYGNEDVEASVVSSDLSEDLEDGMECTEFVLKCNGYYLAKADINGKSWSKNLELAHLYCSEAEAKESLASAGLDEERVECIEVVPLDEEIKAFSATAVAELVRPGPALTVKASRFEELEKTIKEKMAGNFEMDSRLFKMVDKYIIEQYEAGNKAEAKKAADRLLGLLVGEDEPTSDAEFEEYVKGLKD